MRILTTLDLRNETSPCFRKIAKRVSEEILPPFMLLSTCSRWSLSRANADKDTDLSTGPLTDSGFVENLGSWVVFPCAFIDEYILPDLDWFERKSRRASRPTGLPDRAVKFWRWFSS